MTRFSDLRMRAGEATVSHVSLVALEQVCQTYSSSDTQQTPQQSGNSLQTSEPRQDRSVSFSSAPAVNV